MRSQHGKPKHGLELLSLLRTEGPLAPSRVMTHLKISQPTLFRTVRTQSQEVAAFGAKRNRRLAALRKIRGLETEIPVFVVSPDGEIFQVGRLFTLYPGSVWVESLRSRPVFFPGIPFFIDDLRPQGFLGRIFGQKNLDLGLPARVIDWTSDDILEALARRGEDLVGNLLVGVESFRRYQSLTDESVEAIHPEKSYLTLAQAALNGHPPGSSVGGEQPKFTATLKEGDDSYQKVIVKFSPLGDSFSAQRWRDLLICEWIASEVLREHDFLTTNSRILECGGRVFLEMQRFDRVGLGGRRGILSLGALENEWVGRSETWAHSARALVDNQIISQGDREKIEKLESFGQMIGNSDRHSGNLSFFWTPGDPHAILAPVYDMLPMLYAPSGSGEDMRRIFALPTYPPLLHQAWTAMRPVAASYWERVSTHSSVSVEFRKIAAQNLSLFLLSSNRFAR